VYFRLFGGLYGGQSLLLPEGKAVIYEKRTYRCAAGRMTDVLSRFEDVVLALWARHGYKPVGFWTELIGDDSRQLHYLLQWADLAQREACNRAFAADPEWQQARARTDANGPLVEKVSTTILARDALFAAAMTVR
jgi:hypothetical protein